MTQPIATIESLDHEGRGIARIDGKVTFVEGALPGERVTIEVNRRKPRFDSASPVAVLEQSFIRVEPRCPHFGNCGGCSMQHVDPAAQVAIKQRILEDALRHIGNVRPECMLPPIHGLPWGYRQRARLSARYVEKKGGALVGFHEKRSSFLVDMRSCDVLPARISALIMPLRKLVSGLSIRDRLPQIELAAGDTADVLVFRVLQPPTAEDEARFREFADASGVDVWLQPGGPETAFRLHPAEAPELAYLLPEFDVIMPFHPTEFTQVNMAVNRVLVRRTMRLLDPRPGERIADFFCGLGNFTLPMARSGAEAIGYEGSAQLVKRAAQNAARNGLEARAGFRTANLFQATPDWLAAQGRFDKVLIDPPRDGAVELVKLMDPAAIRRIVYVSCNPATLARDAAVLVHTKGYRLAAAGVANMFPHTAHVESIALFEA